MNPISTMSPEIRDLGSLGLGAYPLEGEIPRLPAPSMVNGQCYTACRRVWAASSRALARS